MKYLLLLILLMLSVPAHAINIMYSPYADQDTGEPEMFYLTDQHTPSCEGAWYKAHITNSNTDKEVPINPVCWSYDDDFNIRLSSADFSMVMYGNVRPINDELALTSLRKIMGEAKTRILARLREEFRANQAKPHM